ncbi:hypothetical protein IAD21_03768 [Abditibacteriota bacterium]|nr:hypothetical protein IAD21_03768 [Abditibacteriota bacterium]
MSDVWAHEVDWESIDARFFPPPELQQTIPRRIAPRDSEDMGCRARLERGCLGGCLLPIFLLGLLLMFWGGLAALILPLGTTTTGMVTQRERGNGSDSTYFLHFRFQVGDSQYESQGQVPTEKWKRVRIGDPVRVRYFPFAPGLRPLLADDFSPWASVFGLGTLGLLMTGVAGLPLTGMATRRRGKKLVRDGIVTPAFIVGRDEQKSQFILLVRDRNGRTFEIKERTTGNISYAVGQVETALYLANKPGSARLYRGLDWKGYLP